MYDVDEVKSEAKYQNGILELTLPKKGNGGAGRELPIK
jgi:HSP20 family molecular chaperone IbpA